MDADWQLAYSSGDEAPGGDNPTPDQDVVDEIGEALGVNYEDGEELKGAAKIEDRDKHRWELDPAGDGTALTFTAEVDLPEDYETKVIAGWHIHLDHLEEVLDGGTIDWENWNRDHRPDWERVHEHYTDAD